MTTSREPAGTQRHRASHEQLEVWLSVQREPESGRYNIPLDLEICGEVNIEALRLAIGDLVARHAALRCHFETDGGELVRVEHADVAVPFFDRPTPGLYRRDEALRWAAATSSRPFDVASAPLLRAELRRHADAALLVVTVHHLVADGWSMDVLTRHLVEAYEARLAGVVPELRSSARPQGDLAISAGSADDARTHWKRLLRGEPALLSPLPDLVRSGAAPGPGAHTAGVVSGEALAELRALTARERVSPATVVLAAWALLLHAWSGEDDGVIGMPFSGRNDPATHDEVGLYTRVLPVRTSVDLAQPFAGILRPLGDQILDSMEHSAVPTDLLHVSEGGAGQWVPAFRSVFLHGGAAADEWQVGGSAVRVVEHDGEGAKFDLALAALETSDQLRLRIDYDSAVYARGTAQLLCTQLRDLIAAVAADAGRSCRALLAGLAPAPGGGVSNPPPATGAEPALLPDLVRRHAARRGNAVAVRHGGDVLTYAELMARSGAVAQWLGAQGIGREDIVALLLPPGVETIVMMLASSLAGAAYLPLDPAYPDSQLELVLADARPRMLVTVPEHVGRAQLDGVPVYSTADVLAGARDYPPQPPDVRIEAGMTINVLYTSGSTGRPKGVVLPHGGLARLMEQPQFLPLDESDVVSHLSPLNFDGASYEIWGALGHGAQLVVLDKELVLSPRELRTALRSHGVTTLLVTTPLLNRIIEDAPDLLQSLRRVYFGGELISVSHIRRALRWCDSDTLLHSYGPTENSFTSTWWQITDVDERARTISIGRPVPGTQAYVVFEGTLELAPPGIPGELLLGGAGVARGYLGDPRLTAARFVPDPFSDEPGARLYRTGDRVRWTADGLLEFVGRADNQVKIRSQRVELGEVEAALLAHDAVSSAFVTTRRNQRGEKEIVAYAVLARPGARAEVQAHLRATLPPFAVPTHLSVLDALPLTANGKVDRAGLPEPDQGGAPAPGADQRPDGPAVLRPRTAPRLQTPPGLDAVGAAWRDVLGEARFGLDDNFFDVGGHSLVVVKLQDALRKRTGAAPTIADLLRHTTVRAQAERLGLAGPSASGPALVARERLDEDDIAIVGMACRFAGAPDLGAYWANLAAGRDCLPSTVTATVTELDGGRLRIARWGMIADGTGFDGELFGFAADELRGVDPQHGIFYECLWAAVEDAGLRLSDIHERTSLYAGRGKWPTGGVEPVFDEAPRVDEVTGTDSTFMPTRFSYWHDLWGESLLVDTACSTSLVAVHLACENLRRGSSDYALAGGVSIAHPADGSYTYVPGHLYSRDGLCRPFDKRASGTVGGDGAGAVLLRRLSDAVRDGDPIYAVIRGSAVNNDGRAKVGYTAPGVEGQARVIRTALAAAGVAGRDVDYVETHGTGTRLGDTIEAAALTEALGPDGPPVAVGSAKASIGHTNTAAGIAGLIKTVLGLHHGHLPATPHVGEPIEELIRYGERFHLLPEGQPWPDRDRPRLAGVSSFGVGGTNAHVVVEEFRGAATARGEQR